ncbi:hypothetical protein JG687_00015826 [Phytophthora cactorum]|uniref:Uncharacterized protein n=1 Tax=Phytophthora cactorum TaxID=29920 RepID=A0A8T1TUW5_9STRA|nr:hypothetical protein JG687_00015826 [Phytophthora cactorum]
MELQKLSTATIVWTNRLASHSCSARSRRMTIAGAYSSLCTPGADSGRCRQRLYGDWAVAPPMGCPAYYGGLQRREQRKGDGN